MLQFATSLLGIDHAYHAPECRTGHQTLVLIQPVPPERIPSHLQLPQSTLVHAPAIQRPTTTTPPTSISAHDTRRSHLLPLLLARSLQIPVTNLQSGGTQRWGEAPPTLDRLAAEPRRHQHPRDHSGLAVVAEAAQSAADGVSGPHPQECLLSISPPVLSDIQRRVAARAAVQHKRLGEAAGAAEKVQCAAVGSCAVSLDGGYTGVGAVFEAS